MEKLTVKENWDTYRYQIMDGSPRYVRSTKVMAGQ